MVDDCVFCKMVKGEIEVAKIYEDDKHLVFMDGFPYLKGQVLVIPKKHVKNYLDMQEEDYLDLMKLSRKIAEAMKQAFKPLVVALVIEGLEVPHVHVKLYPIRQGEYLGIPAGEKPEQKELAELSEVIKKQLKMD